MRNIVRIEFKQQFQKRRIVIKGTKLLSNPMRKRGMTINIFQSLFFYPCRDRGWDDTRLQHTDGGTVFQEKERIGRNFHRIRKRLGYSGHVCFYKRSDHVS